MCGGVSLCLFPFDALYQGVYCTKIFYTGTKEEWGKNIHIKQPNVVRSKDTTAMGSADHAGVKFHMLSMSPVVNDAVSSFKSS
jgi:hypothetical protein